MSGIPPTIVTTAGMQPQSPASLLAQLLALVASTNPGYTANLPGSLIEDVSSTDVGAISECDQARVELFNSLTPYGANAFLLNQLGQIYGVPLGQGSNATVNVVFTGTVGFVIAQGFTVSDGTFQYTIQDGGIVGTGGVSPPLSALATSNGVWPIPANTVNQIVTSVPSSITLSVTNPLAGTPGTGPQTEWDYRSQVLQAGLAASMGMARYLKTLLGNVSGVQTRLIAVRQQTGGGYEVIVGGGDNYEVAYAIFRALFDISSNNLVGSIMVVIGITNANPGVVTTLLNHGYTTGEVITITGIVGMTALNSVPLTITVLTEKTFSVGVDTTGFGAYVSGGVCEPNPRNIVVSITDYPDVYNIPFVSPPAQTVTMVVTWNTTATNFTGAAAVQQLGVPALVNYINSIPVGAPILLYELQEVFSAAISSALPPQFLTRMVFAVSINGVGTAPESGTGIIPGDPESYMLCDPTGSGINVVQG